MDAQDERYMYSYTRSHESHTKIKGEAWLEARLAQRGVHIVIEARTSAKASTTRSKYQLESR